MLRWQRWPRTKGEVPSPPALHLDNLTHYASGKPSDNGRVPPSVFDPKRACGSPSASPKQHLQAGRKTKDSFVSSLRFSSVCARGRGGIHQTGSDGVHGVIMNMSMSARKFGASWWSDFRHEHKRYRLRSPDNSKAGARAYEATLRQKLARGESVESQTTVTKQEEKTFEAFALEWMETYCKTNNKRSTVRSKYNSLRANLIPYFGRKMLSQITDHDVEQFKAAQLKRGLSPKSLNNELTILRRCLKSAVEWELLVRAPKMRQVRVAPQKYSVLTQDEAERLVQSAPEPMWRDMIVCGLNTGMRLGELCALTWEDINLTTKTLVVRHSLVEGVLDSPKNNRVRVIPLTDDLYKLLRERTIKKGFVFAHPNGGHLRKSSWPWKALGRACRAAGLRRIGWHALRHTFASELVRRGAAIRAVQLLMGHSTVQMTERYSHLAPSTLRETVSLLGRNQVPESHKTFFGQQVGNITEKQFVEVG